MEATNYRLIGNFSNTRILHVSDMEAHDMLIATLRAGEPGKEGPLARVYNYAGSAAYMPIYEYLRAMVQEYGRLTGDEDVILPELDFLNGPDSIADAKRLVIRDGLEEDIYMNLISLPPYIGFQTYATGKGTMPKMEGPIVWFHKAMPKVRDQAKALDAMIRDKSAHRAYEVV